MFIDRSVLFMLLDIGIQEVMRCSRTLFSKCNSQSKSMRRGVILLLLLLLHRSLDGRYRSGILPGRHNNMYGTVRTV
jgi:hypothetical protein